MGLEMTKVKGLLFCSMFLFLALEAVTEEQKKKWMIEDLITLKHTLEISYAPLEWKKEYDGWDLEQAYEKAKKEVLDSPFITSKQFHQVVRRFCDSMHDYHVKAVFLSKERASLPFSVNEVEGRFFIDWIDQSKMPSFYYGLNVGDELLEFGNCTPGEEILKIKKSTGRKYSNEKTDRAITAKSLTARFGMIGDEVPKGSIVIKVLSHQTNNVHSRQLMWDYQKESVKNYFDLLQSLNFSFGFFQQSKKITLSEKLKKNLMLEPIYSLFVDEAKDRGVLGGKESFVPKLGRTTWINGEEKKGGDEDSLESDQTNMDENLISSQSELWNAYIYVHDNGSKIGYIRIPHFVGDQEDAIALGEIIQRMEKETEALVIDQVNNPGGELFYLYYIASMLTTDLLVTPHHRFKINQEDALEALKAIGELNSDLKELRRLGKQNLEEDSSIYQKLLFLKSFYQFILDEWNEGRSFTNPSYIFGVDMINPHYKYRYSKPILILINELNFSGGDFFPAIFQDNQRATLFGSRTAGAGGCVKSMQFQNRSGIAHVTNTFTLAERKNLNKIEDLGVTPDIEYEVTLADVLSNYASYAVAVNHAIVELLGKEQSKQAASVKMQELTAAAEETIKTLEIEEATWEVETQEDAEVSGQI